MDSEEFLSNSLWNKPYPVYLVDYIKSDYSNLSVGHRVWFWCGFNPQTKTMFHLSLDKTETDWVISLHPHRPLRDLTILDEYIERLKEIEAELDWYDREDDIRIFYQRPEESVIDIPDSDEVVIPIPLIDEVVITIPEKNDF
jgi:hypothetical protein